MVPAFRINDRVVALDSVQGMVKDQQYKVVNWHRATCVFPAGDIITYFLLHVPSGNTLQISNGHLLLKRVS